MTGAAPGAPARATTAAPTTPTSLLAGVWWMLLTTLLFACVTAIVRHVGSSVSAAEGGFLRYLFGLLLVLPWLRPLLADPPPLSTLAVFAVRGVLHGFGVILWFYAMARLPVAEVTALGYLAPLFVTMGAALFFGETLHKRRLGALVILRPGISPVGLAHLAQIAAAPLFAGSYLIAKRLSGRDDPAVIVAMLSLGCTIVLLPGAVMTWTWPSLGEIAWFFLTAVFATAGHYTMTRALRAAPLTVTQPVLFLQLVWATVMGIVLFDEGLDPFVLVGGAIVVGAVTFIAHREARNARAPITPPAPVLKA
jgi:drug/metabolite transporter (DMT)-like permease